MDFKLYFCTDGILRAKLSDDKPMIPVKFLQDNGEFAGNDFKFWTRWWESKVYFEEGLTVSKFLFCLEPWAEFWSDITNKNVGEYIKEARIPVVVKNANSDDPPLDWVGLFYYTEAESETEYAREDDDLFEKDLNEWLNSPKSVRLTGRWNIHSAYKLSGFIKGKQEQYCIDFTPMSELANVPFILSGKQWLHFGDWQIKRNLGEETDHVFKEDAFGVCRVGNMKFFVGDREHIMRDVVEGFFWWIPSNPTRRQDFLDQINSTKDELEHINEEEFPLEFNNNVVSLFKDESIKEDDHEGIVEDEEEKKKLKIKVASGAFSSIIEGNNRDNQYWEEMLSLAYKSNNVVLKIGKTEVANELENRVFSYVIEPDDKLANPQPTEYKIQ